MRRMLIALLLIALALPVFAAGGAEQAGETGPILIGAVYPLSGSMAPIGQNCKRGVDFAVEELNAKGGILGRPVEIVYGDSVGDPKTGMSEAERLITTRNVVALIGAYQSAVTNVVSEVAQRYKVPMVTAISTADPITTRGVRVLLPPRSDQHDVSARHGAVQLRCEPEVWIGLQDGGIHHRQHDPRPGVPQVGQVLG